MPTVTDRSVAVLYPYSSPIDRLEEDLLVTPGIYWTDVNGFSTPKDSQYCRHDMDMDMDV